MDGPHFLFETTAHGTGARFVIGVDEAGRGPLAGPVTAAAVRLRPDCIPPGLNDSKQLDRRQREALFAALLDCAEIGIGHASVEEIDTINILRASHLAMCRAIAALPFTADHVLIDGNMIPRDLTCRSEAIIGGDALVPVDRRSVDHRQGDARPDHGGFGATAPRLRLGTQRRISHPRSCRRPANSGCDPCA